MNNSNNSKYLQPLPGEPMLRSSRVQVVVLGVLGPFGRELQGQAAFGHLKEPDAG